jgi:hypothetical protein
MKNLAPDYRDGGPSSNRATDSQIYRLIELKIKFDHRVLEDGTIASCNLTWLEAKKLLKDFHKNKASK